MTKTGQRGIAHQIVMPITQTDVICKCKSLKRVWSGFWNATWHWSVDGEQLYGFVLSDTFWIFTLFSIIKLFILLIIKLFLLLIVISYLIIKLFLKVKLTSFTFDSTPHSTAGGRGERGELRLCGFYLTAGLKPWLCVWYFSTSSYKMSKWD